MQWTQHRRQFPISSLLSRTLRQFEIESNQKDTAADAQKFAQEVRPAGRG
jgi:hypothetical protein